MTAKPKKLPEPEILNPRYKGATPEMVALALLRQKPNEPKNDDEPEVVNPPPYTTPTRPA